MSRSIDTIGFHLFIGRVANLKLVCDVFSVFGQDGVGVQVGGSSDGQSQLSTVFFASNIAAAESHIVACENLQGTIVSCVDAFGNQYDNCLVSKVDTNNCAKAVIYLGNVNAVRVQIGWTFERVA